MIWVIAIIAVVLVAIFGNWWDWGECVLYTGLAIVIAILLAAGFCGCCGSLASYSENPQTVESTEIIAMHDGSGTSGRIGGIFCVSGTVDEKPVYKVLLMTEKGLQTKTYKASETYVRFTDEAPRVEEQKIEALGFWNFFCGNGVLDKTEYAIYIPKDSVVANDFVLDLE